MPAAPGYHRGQLVIPGVIAVTLEWLLANSTLAHNVLHCQNTLPQPMSEALCNTVFDGIVGTAEWTAYALMLNEATRLNAVKMRNLDVGGENEFVSTSTAEPGTATGIPLPAGVALSVAIKTQVSGRSGRGRVYLTGFDADAAVDSEGKALAGLVTAAPAFVQMVREILGGQSLTLGVAHRQTDEYVSRWTGNTIPARDAGWIQCTQVVLPDAIFDSQRRRY